MESASFGPADAPITGYVCGDANAPGVVVLQEWWGVTENIKLQAQHLSKRGGYRCLVPDLYRGKLGVNVEEARSISRRFPYDRVRVVNVVP
jgi:carboxymethylenebutenolidase